MEIARPTNGPIFKLTAKIDLGVPLNNFWRCNLLGRYRAPKQNLLFIFTFTSTTFHRNVFNEIGTNSSHAWPTDRQVRIKGKGNGGNCPGPSAPRGPPWWHSFVLNIIFVWKIVVIQEIQEDNSILRCCVKYHQCFLCKFDLLPVLVITAEYKYFRFCSMQIYFNFACNFS